MNQLEQSINIEQEELRDWIEPTFERMTLNDALGGSGVYDATDLAAASSA